MNFCVTESYPAFGNVHDSREIKQEGLNAFLTFPITGFNSVTSGAPPEPPLHVNWDRSRNEHLNLPWQIWYTLSLGRYTVECSDGVYIARYEKKLQLRKGGFALRCPVKRCIFA